jgi:hypothetical protein
MKPLPSKTVRISTKRVGRVGSIYKKSSNGFKSFHGVLHDLGIPSGCLMLHMNTNVSNDPFFVVIGPTSPSLAEAL